LVDITRAHLPAGLPKKEFQLFATVKHIWIIDTCFFSFSGDKLLSSAQQNIGVHMTRLGAILTMKILKGPARFETRTTVM